VLHILGANRIEPARMTWAARPQADCKLIYPVFHKIERVMSALEMIGH
jgi:hypothetical protein